MEKLNEFQATGKWPGMKSKVVENQAWSEKQDKKARKVERKRKKELKKEVKFFEIGTLPICIASQFSD